MKTKKVLMIINEFPPLWGGGTPRPFAFARYLKKYNWHPTILSLDPAYYNLALGNAPDKLKLLDTDIEVIRTKTFRPIVNKPNDTILKENKINFEEKQQLPGIKGYINSFIRKWIFIPDQEITWYRPAVKKGLELLKNEKFDLIFSSSPPESVHMIGAALQHKSGVPWIADFRDAFYYDRESADSKLNHKLRSFIMHKIMHKVGKRASAYICVTPRIKKQVAYYLQSNIPGLVLENGFDPDDFYNLPSIALDNKFINICYMGRLTGEYVTPHFINGIKKILCSKDGKLEKIYFHFIGRTNASFRNAFSKHPRVSMHGVLPHQKALSYIKQCDINLLTDPWWESYPGKLFEYISVKKPIIFLVQPSSLVEEFASVNKVGYLGYIDNAQSIYDTFVKALHNFSDTTKILTDDQFISKFNRQIQTGILAKYFDKILTNRQNK